MSTPAPDPASPISAQIPLPVLLNAISSPARWQMLGILAAEGRTGVTEMASRIGISVNSGSKHIRVLLDAGLVRSTHSRLYCLNEIFPLLPNAAGIEFGHCQIRFGVPVAKAAKRG